MYYNNNNNNNNTIRFFSENSRPEGILSNFAKLEKPIIIYGRACWTSEHAFQMMKYIYNGNTPIDEEYATIISQARTPNMSKILANQKLNYRYDWQKELNVIINDYKSKGAKPNPFWNMEVKFDDGTTTIYKEKIMSFVLQQKCAVSVEFCNYLNSTRGKKLEEVSPYDDYWATGKDGKGQNRLGILLMELRDRHG